MNGRGGLGGLAKLFGVYSETWRPQKQMEAEQRAIPSMVYNLIVRQSLYASLHTFKRSDRTSISVLTVEVAGLKFSTHVLLPLRVRALDMDLSTTSLLSGISQKAPTKTPARNTRSSNINNSGNSTVP